MSGTKRENIDSLRQKLRERNADSNFPNQFLYKSLMENARWLIKREISAGRIYSNTSFFQTLGCQEIEEVVASMCCDIKTNCKMYRTKYKLPAMWIDNKGPVIQTVTSIDGTTEFFLTTPTTWQNKRMDPYQKMSSMKYAFVSDDYIWFPENNPRFVNLVGFFVDDIRLLPKDRCSCEDKNEECVRFLDTKFMIPEWLEAEMFAKTLEQLTGYTMRLQPDNQIDKNETRKN